MRIERTAARACRGEKPPRRLQIYLHPGVAGAEALAKEMSSHLRGLGVRAEAVPTDDEAAMALIPAQDMLAVVGGDGTLLRVGGLAAPHGIPVLGVNLGRLGFLAEVQPSDWKAVLARILVGDYWIEKRTMLRTEHYRGDDMLGSYDVLNEAVVSRGALARPIRLHTMIDGDQLTTYVADGLIAATATGSTAYALAVGGPILPPELNNILIIPIAPHLCVERAIVLSPGVTLQIHVRTDHQAILSADGQVEVPLQNDDLVVVRKSPFITRFARVQDPVYFYRNLTSRMSQNPAAEEPDAARVTWKKKAA